jgi:muramoyltetrapeptide carboxypeptidase
MYLIMQSRRARLRPARAWYHAIDERRGKGRRQAQLMSSPRHRSYRLHTLRPGGRVRLIAPAGSFPIADFERGVASLRERYDVSFDPSIVERSGYFAGSDERRSSELRAALADDTVDAIIAVRGGFGAARLLAELDPERIARQPKLLVGFSDISALHALWARAGLASIHGAMVAALGRSDAPRIARWQRALEGELPAGLNGLSALAPGRARGPLLGGNLAVLTSLIGTPYLPDLTGCVLFLEDIAERPYRIDRMLTTWHQAGVLQQPAAIALGAFTDCEPGPDGVPVEHVLQQRLGALGIPVVSGVPAGHLDDNLELPLGAYVELDADAGTIAFEGGYA